LDESSPVEGRFFKKRLMEAHTRDELFKIISEEDEKY
jgi:hypothetical protein